MHASIYKCIQCKTIELIQSFMTCMDIMTSIICIIYAVVYYMLLYIVDLKKLDLAKHVLKACLVWICIIYLSSNTFMICMTWLKHVACMYSGAARFAWIAWVVSLAWLSALHYLQVLIALHKICDMRDLYDLNDFYELNFAAKNFNFQLIIKTRNMLSTYPYPMVPGLEVYTD